MRRNFLCISMIIGLMLNSPVVSQAEMKPILKKRVGTPPFEIAREIIRANQAFQKKAARHSISASEMQAPFFVWLTDADTRISLKAISAGEQDILTIRNMGSQFEAATAPIDYAVRNHFTPFLLITGSTDSPAIRWLIAPPAVSPSITKAVNSIRPAIIKEYTASSLAYRLAKYAEQNIDYQVRLAVERYNDRVKSGRLVVAGSILDLSDYYGRGRGALLIINVNGETITEKLKAMPVMRQLDPDSLDAALGREPIRR